MAHWIELVIIATISMLLVFCEWLFSLENILGGLVLALLTIIGAYVLASMDTMQAATAEALDTMTVIPLFIILAAAWPGFLMDETLLIPAVYTMLAALAWRHIKVKGLDLSKVGLNLNAWPTNAAVGLLLGLLAGVLGFLLLPDALHLPAFTRPSFLQNLFLFTCLVAPVEELLFRGLIQRSLIPVLGVPGALMLTAILFTVTHQPWQSFASATFIFALGLLLGAVYQRSGSLLAPVLIHGVGQTITFSEVLLVVLHAPCP